MNLRMLALAVLLLGTTALAADPEDRSKLMGKWVLQTGEHSEKSPAWMVQDKGETIRITRTVGEQTVSDFECGLGQECKVKDSGKSAQVTIYFNGPKLVELETKGNDVVKRLFTVAPKADTLEIEVIPVVPAGETEKLVFKRATVTEAK